MQWSQKGKTKVLRLAILDKAKSDQKPVLVFFMRSKGKCSSVCLGLEKKVFQGKKIATLLKQFYAVKIDLAQLDKKTQVALKKTYGVSSLPLVVVATYNGKKAYRMEKKIQPAQALKKIQSILNWNMKYRKAKRKKGPKGK